jgi:hypothetical protein
MAGMIFRLPDLFRRRGGQMDDLAERFPHGQAPRCEVMRPA